jgi:N-acetylneuraminic acid mutarotase
MPTGRRDMAAAVVNNSLGQPILYVVGGYNDRDEYVTRVEAHNYSTNRWTITSGLTPFGSAASNGVGVIGGKLYISGGEDHPPSGGDQGDTPHAGLFVYDPVSNVFSVKANMPRTSTRGVSGVIGGRLYVLSGACGIDCTHRLTRRLYRYDPSTDAWNATLPWCPNAHVMGGGGVINGKFYVAGGLDANGVVSARLDVYNPTTNSWKALAPMPVPLLGPGAVIKNNLYIMAANGAKTMYAYDPVTNKWTTKASMITGGGGIAAAALVTPSGNPKILVVGGSNSNGYVLTTTELYTP